MAARTETRERKRHQDRGYLTNKKEKGSIRIWRIFKNQSQWGPPLPPGDFFSHCVWLEKQPVPGLQ